MNGIELIAHSSPDPSVCRALTDLHPENPFYTAAYLEARGLRGFGSWIFLLTVEGSHVAGCSGFSRARRLERSLEITSTPALPDEAAHERFWEGLLAFCRRERFLDLKLGSFASSPSVIPSLPGEISRRARREHVLDLQDGDLFDRLSSTHARYVRRCRKLGLEIRRASDEESCRDHARLVGASMRRRRERGEAVPGPIDAAGYSAFTATGAGVLFQAVQSGIVLSSILVLTAERGAYYQSAGTSPEGMSIGASHFLVHEVSVHLRAASLRTFNLGGAGDESPGLERFKAGFGTRCVPLEAVEARLGGAVVRSLMGVRRLTGLIADRLFRGAHSRARAPRPGRA